MSALDQSGKNSELLNSLAGDAYKVLSDGQVTFGEIVSLGGSLGGKVNQFQQLSGLEKRELVLKAVDLALEKILKELGDEPSDLDRLQKVKEAADFAKKHLPSVLDPVVGLSSGGIDLKSAQNLSFLQKLISVISQCVSRPAIAEPIKASPAPEAPTEGKIHEAVQEPPPVAPCPEPAPAPEPALADLKEPAEETVVSSKEEMTSPAESIENRKE